MTPTHYRCNLCGSQWAAASRGHDAAFADLTTHLRLAHPSARWERNISAVTHTTPPPVPTYTS